MNVLIDTGVWYAFCDNRERRQERASVEKLLISLEHEQVLLPWPVVYETVRTRLSRNQAALQRLETLLARPNLEFVEDAPYRERALHMAFEMALRKRAPRPLSMVDCLLRVMLDDRGLKVGGFATYNERDFRDVCLGRRIEMIR